MTLNDTEKMQRALELLEQVLDETPKEILECFSGKLLSEEEVAELLDTMR